MATLPMAVCSSSLVIAFNSVSLSGGGIGVLTFALSGVRSLRFGRSFVPDVVVRALRLFFWVALSESASVFSVGDGFAAGCALAVSVEVGAEFDFGAF